MLRRPWGQGGLRGLAELEGMFWPDSLGRTLDGAASAEMGEGARGGPGADPERMVRARPC